MEKEVNTDHDHQPRLQPRSMAEMQENWIKILERIPGSTLKGPYSPVNVLGTLMYNPRTMGTFLDYWVTSKLEMAFTVREQELVILRMGFLYRCNYVWKHHVPVAKEFGASDDELQAVKTNPLPGMFSGRDYALLMLTDEMVEHRTIRDEAWNQWGNRLTGQELVDLVSLISQYTFFALFNNSLRIEIEEPLQGIAGL